MACISYLKELRFLILDLHYNKITKYGMDNIFNAISKMSIINTVIILLNSNKIDCEDLKYPPYDFS